MAWAAIHIHPAVHVLCTEKKKSLRKYIYFCSSDQNSYFKDFIDIYVVCYLHLLPAIRTSLVILKDYSLFKPFSAEMTSQLCPPKNSTVRLRSLNSETCPLLGSVNYHLIWTENLKKVLNI